MKNRIWSDLCNSIFYVEYLGLYINRLKFKNKVIETILLASSLISVVGWNKYAEYSAVWTSVLLIVAIVRLLKSRFITSDKEIYTFENVKSFYLDHCRDLDKLWFEYINESLNEKQAEKKFNLYNDAERLMIKIEKHDKIFGKEPFQSKAEKLAHFKLNKYK